MMPSIIKQQKNKQMFLFVVSVDKMFQKKLNHDIDTSVFDHIIERGSGEGLFKELTFNPLPKRASAIVLIDYTLIDRDHPYAKNGLEVLMELGDKYPKIQRILLLAPADKSVKNRAIKMGVEHVLIKNDNLFIRLDILLKGLISRMALSRARYELRQLILIFGLIVLVAGSIIIGFTMAGL